MRRLSPTDALLLYSETPRAYMHTLKIAILDPSEEPGGVLLRRLQPEGL
jgi:diacylglycerol O-acyltransferase / wax synthase